MCVRVNRVSGSTSSHLSAPLATLHIPPGCWEFISTDIVFGLPYDSEVNTGIVVFVDRLSKMAHMAAVPEIIDGEGIANLSIEYFIKSIFL